MSNARNLADIIGAAGTPVVTSNTSFSANVAVTGAATFSNTVAVTGNVTFSNTTTHTGTATFSNTVTVANNITFADSTAISSSPVGFKNRIINGDFRVWQRGTTGTSHAVGAFGPDRWRNYGGNAITLSSSSSYGAPQSVLLQGTGTNHAIGQRIESKNIADLAGQVVTLSYKIRADYPSNHNLLMYYAAGVDDFTTESAFVNTNTTYVSTDVTTMTHTITLPANASRGIDIVFQWYNASSFSETAFIWDVQLEAGSVATPFERRPYGLEFGLCQRYYQSLGNMPLSAYSASGVLGFTYPAPMRATPTVTFSYNGTNNAVYRFTDAAVQTLSSPTVIATPFSLGTFYAFTPTSWASTPGYGYQASFTLSAEL